MRDEEFDVAENSEIVISIGVSTNVVILNRYIYGKYDCFCLSGLINSKTLTFYFL